MFWCPPATPPSSPIPTPHPLPFPAQAVIDNRLRAKTTHIGFNASIGKPAHTPAPLAGVVGDAAKSNLRGRASSGGATVPVQVRGEPDRLRSHRLPPSYMHISPLFL
eukprot:scaffold16319_cov96-Isochrysis_galbana.AAC.1